MLGGQGMLHDLTGINHGDFQLLVDVCRIDVGNVDFGPIDGQLPGKPEQGDELGLIEQDDKLIERVMRQPQLFLKMAIISTARPGIASRSLSSPV
jgi:hypothetical protein